jgi:hypothetical protein
LSDSSNEATHSSRAVGFFLAMMKYRGLVKRCRRDTRGSPLAG